MSPAEWIGLVSGVSGLLLVLLNYLRGRRADRQKDRELEAAEAKADAETELKRDEFLVGSAAEIVGMLRDELARHKTDSAEKIDALREEAQTSRVAQGERIGSLEQEMAALRRSEQTAVRTVERMKRAFGRWFAVLQRWDREGRPDPMPVMSDEDMHLFEFTKEIP